MKFGVVVFPGSNCDADCYHVLKDVLRVPVEYIWHQEKSVQGFDALILPGGFSYGDYLRTGAIARFSPIMMPIMDYAHKGGLIIGICNGFQILLEAGLLPGAMLRNTSLKFICETTTLRVEHSETPFTTLFEPHQIVEIPIAHGAGNYFCDESTLQTLRAKRQIVFTYCDERGQVLPEANPNGSTANIAGIVNEKGNILGMMPHPERCAEAMLGGESGRLVFVSMLQWFQEVAG